MNWTDRLTGSWRGRVPRGGPPGRARRWLPGLVPGAQAITVRELLQHTSGIYDHTNDPGGVVCTAGDLARSD